MTSKTEPSAKIICDSLSPDGSRLTTMEVVMHRFVLAVMARQIRTMGEFILRK